MRKTCKIFSHPRLRVPSKDKNTTCMVFVWDMYVYFDLEIGVELPLIPFMSFDFNTLLFLEQ